MSISIDNALSLVKNALDSARNHSALLDAAARSALACILYNRQSTPMRVLLEGLRGTGTDVSRIRQWAERNGAIKVMLDKDTGGLKISFTEKAAKEGDYDKNAAQSKAASFEPIFSVSKDNKAFESFDFDAELAKLLARAATMAEAKSTRVLRKSKKAEPITLNQVQIDAIKLGKYETVVARLSEGRRIVEPEITLN